MRKIFVLSFLLCSVLLSNAQSMRIWHAGAYTSYEVANIDSITFLTKDDEEREILYMIGMAEVYSYLDLTFGRRYMEAQCLSSDEFTALSFSGNWYDNGTYAHQAYHTTTADDLSTGWYSNLTSGISKTNMILKNLGSSAPDEMTASVRAMRAFFTWILMDSYGRAPILDHLPEAEEKVALSSRSEVCNWIESELKDVIPYLTTDVTEETYGKPTRWMAEALLAKIYINWPVYQCDNCADYDAATASNEKLDECISLCDDIINSGKFNLGSMDYLHKFSYDNSCKVEDFVYAIPYDAISRQGMQYARPRTFKGMKNIIPNIYGDTNTFNQSFGGNIVVTPECVKRFNLPGDIRNNCILVGDVYVHDPNTLLATSTPFEYKSTQVHYTTDITLVRDDGTIDVGDNFTGWQQGAHSIKWFTCAADYNNGRNQSNDLPIFRYADILLEKAEAMVRANKLKDGEDTSLSLFNQIRSYAGAPLLTDIPSLDDIYEERGREFFDENWRRNDMIRFGHFEDEFFPHYKSSKYASFSKSRRVFPIPQEQLDINGWEQNPYDEN